MDPLSIVASVVAVLQLSAKVVGYLNDVQAASKERAKCAIEVANLTSLLTILRYRLEEADLSVPWYSAVRDLGVENGPLDQFKQALEELKSGMTECGKLTRLGNALVWKFRKEEIASILSRIERLKTLAQVALQNDHLSVVVLINRYIGDANICSKLSQAIKNCGESILSNTESIKTDAEYMRHEGDLAKHSKLLAWISPTDYPAQQSDFISRRQKGTGQWFLNSSQFGQWIGQPNGTLFCPGIPGAGKTMVAATAINHLLNSAQKRSVGIVYVYCNYKAQKDQDAAGLLAAILKQLVQSQPSLMEHILRLYVQHANAQTKPSVQDILAALRSLLADFSTLYVIIDALDECQDDNGTRRSFLASLRGLQASTDLRLMVTSRFIPDINDEFLEAMRLEVRAGDEDVAQFLRGQISRLPKCVQRNSALQDLVVRNIAEAVDGMYGYQAANSRAHFLQYDRFLLARLHSDSLLDKRTPKEIKTTLANLPNGSAALDDAYGEAIQRIEGQLSGDCERARKALSFITYTERPLTIAELCCALAVEPGASELDPENIPDVDDLVSVCAGLVVIDEESAIIRLVHYTTQEYFERIGKQWMSNAQCDIASTCITYLSFDAFKSGGSPTNGDFAQRLREHEFLDYAAKHWANHVLPVQMELREQASTYLANTGLVMSTAHVLVRSPAFSARDYAQLYDNQTTGLHITASFGLHVLARELMTRLGAGFMTALHARNRFGQSPLHVAAQMGHVEIVKLLLDKAVDAPKSGSSSPGQEFPYRDDSQWTALAWAAVHGHADVVKLLVAKGVLATAFTAKRGVFPLYVAASWDRTEIIQLLISYGVTPDLQDERGECALAKAAYDGANLALETLLSMPGVDADTRDYYGRSLLWWAASGGSITTVKLLLEKYHLGPHVADNCGRLPLTIASVKRHQEVVDLLSSIRAEKDVPPLDGKELMDRVSSSDVRYVGCDVCGMYAVDHWHCFSCAGGDFDICEQCATKGAGCLDETHRLLKRVGVDGIWVVKGYMGSA